MVLVAIADVHVQIPHRAAGASVMERARGATEAEDGCIRCAFAELIGEPGHFLVMQEWEDRAALDAHYRSVAFVAYQEQIEPLLVRSSELRVHEVAGTVDPVQSDDLDLRQDD